MMPTVRFPEENLSVEVEVGTTILEAAEEVGAHVGSSCGGQCACSTCHVYIRAGEDALSEMSEAEDDRLDMGFDVRPESRLACQAAIEGQQEIVVAISEESVKAWYDEHPKERQAAGKG